jgi:hypothetical protein
MKPIRKLLDRMKGLSGAMGRYPLTAAFLIAAALILAVSIHTGQDRPKLLLSCAVGAFLCGTAQAAYERFFRGGPKRILLLGLGAVLTLGYYLIVRPAPELSMEVGIRTGVALLALYFAFIWFPAVRSETAFGDSFLAAFKAFFHSLLYAAVIFGGCALILAAIDTLIVSISYKAYSYTADAVFVLFAPLFFLSLIPVYPGEGDREADPEEREARDERVRKAVSCPRFLEVLLSYIVIPLTAAFTVILVLYIALNISGPFWTNNLLEPLLVSYAVTVIVVTVLTAGLTNRFAVYFRRVFPKVMIPVVAFQIVSSTLLLRETGVTHTRYFVILFGAFAICSGIVLSFLPIKKHGLVAALLIVFSAVSVIPPFDAFSTSFRSQKGILTAVLEQNGMLQNGAVTPSASLSDEAKKKIVSSVEYLDRMDYLGRVDFLPEDFQIYNDFNDTFGFHAYDLPPDTVKSVYVDLNQNLPLDIAGYDVLGRTYLSSEDQNGAVISEIQNAGSGSTRTKETSSGGADLVLTDGEGREVIRFHTADVFSRYLGYTGDQLQLSQEEATFTQENDRAVLTVIVQNASISKRTSSDVSYEYADVFILIRFK